MTRAKASPATTTAESTRTRLKAAQASEAAAVASVHAAAAAMVRAQEKFDAAVALRQGAVEEAAVALAHAYAELVSASGVDRAALILDLPRVTLKAAVTRAAGNPPRSTSRSSGDSTNNVA
jgi:hypothetical protein